MSGPTSEAVAAPAATGWEAALHALRGGAAAAPLWEDVYGPLRAGRVDDLLVIAQLGQSLDGRIATPTGHSHYINGSAGLDHLHRLRALVDAVVVGVGTATAWLRLASMIGPIAVGFMIATGLQSVFLAFGLLAVLTAIITALLAVETKQRILEEVSP